MSAALELAKPVPAPHGDARAPSAPRTAAPAARPRSVVARLAHAWLQRAAWAVGRTGRSGLVGVALLLAATLFLLSTHLPAAAEVETLRAELAAAQRRTAPAPAVEVPDPTAALRGLPARADMPALLRQLFAAATQARLALDAGRYDVDATRRGSVIRHRVAFPVAGPYPRIRAFLDATLATMPEVGVSDLVLERRAISDGDVEAQLRLVVFTSPSGAAGPKPPPGAEGAGKELRREPGAAAASSERVVAPAHASALFAQHSWLVLAPTPPPPPPPPPPAPSAPPLPYAFVGSYSPQGQPPVWFLARGDHVIDAHVGDRLDGVYQLESAAGGQLVFVYLPLGIRQTLAAGVSR